MHGTGDPLDPLRARLRQLTLAPERDRLVELITVAGLDAPQRARIAADAANLVRAVRAGSEPSLMEQFLGEYGLSTAEGVGLMCLAEALLRVPDAETIDDLIRDKIEPSDWGAHLGRSSSSLVNASTWALMLTGRLLDDDAGDGPAGVLRGLIRRLGEPVVRVAVARSMKALGQQFVLGQTIGDAVRRGRASAAAQGGGRTTYSFDMLGEAARTAADAVRYHRAYADAITALLPGCGPDARDNPGISVKLSALHPRYEFAQRERVLRELVPRVVELAALAARGPIGLNIDAEEADRLDLSLDVVAATLASPSLAGWTGFGVVVQGYGRRALAVIDWLYALAARLDRRIMVRLVKGAYWDSEIKRAQELGLDDFPVLTRKAHTDVSYIACARRLFALRDRIYPQFATHNAHSCAAVLAIAGEAANQVAGAVAGGSAAAVAGFEFQRLHGMGEALHRIVQQAHGARLRIYAPVGAHRDLLAYLVRRLLENGANSSFVNQIADHRIAPERIAADPFDAAEAGGLASNPRITPPPALYLPLRRNARGWDLTDPGVVAALTADRAKFDRHRWTASPQWAAARPGGPGDAAAGDAPRLVRNPADPDEVVGEVRDAGRDDVAAAVAAAGAGFADWQCRPVAERADLLREAADRYERHAAEFFSLLCREAGKTLRDAVAEVREAVDFLRYYAAEAERLAAGGETVAGRGVIVCISPWNFPLAIFTGQIAAALVAGNAVIAKPSEQTALIAARAVDLLREAGVPAAALQCLPGDGAQVGAALTSDPRIAGVLFTGSTEVARLIDRALAAGAAPDAVLVAETGGLNAMIVDSTALPEQAVRDIAASAFQSAGQRCSALRVLYLQTDIADRVLEMLYGAMDELVIGDPRLLETDVGPLIDDEARQSIDAHAERANRAGRLLKRLPVPAGGCFVGPQVIRVAGIAEVEREVFGPVLHVATFEADQLDAVVAAINARGYGLTFGLHTRIDDRVQQVVERIRAGNVYVNRNQIGAVVGVQPFGGEGLSGTGPKAGGPHYLPRLFRADGDRPAPDAPDAPDAPARAGPAMPTDAGVGAADGTADNAEEGVEEGDAIRSAQVRLSGPAAAWCARADRFAALRAGFDGLLPAETWPRVEAASAACAGDLRLSGPTGESNRLRLVPRSTALCFGPAPDAIWLQAIQALAAGGAAVAVLAGAGAHPGTDRLERWRREGLPVEVIVAPASHRDPLWLAEPLSFGLVACAGPDRLQRRIRTLLAARDGDIRALVIEPWSPTRYSLERVLSIDTTAAGGNASLLAAAAGS